MSCFVHNAILYSLLSKKSEETKTLKFKKMDQRILTFLSCVYSSQKLNKSQFQEIKATKQFYASEYFFKSWRVQLWKNSL